MAARAMMVQQVSEIGDALAQSSKGQHHTDNNNIFNMFLQKYIK
jgi:hypothetical protein